LSALSVELRRLARESSSEEVRKEAQGALWILEDKTASEDTANAKDAGKKIYFVPMRSITTCNYDCITLSFIVNTEKYFNFTIFEK